MASVEERVKEIIAEQLGLEKDDIQLDASFIDDLGADSLDIVEMIMTIEDEYDVEISDDDAEKIGTVQDAINYIKEKM
jgi:acyl carrier protein